MNDTVWPPVGKFRPRLSRSCTITVDESPAVREIGDASTSEESTKRSATSIKYFPRRRGDVVDAMALSRPIARAETWPVPLTEMAGPELAHVTAGGGVTKRPTAA